jgi:hypothetical protein
MNIFQIPHLLIRNQILPIPQLQWPSNISNRYSVRFTIMLSRTSIKRPDANIGIIEAKPVFREKLGIVGALKKKRIFIKPSVLLLPKGSML